MLNKDKLIHNIRMTIDEEYSDFIGFPESYEEAIIRWTFIFSDYYKDVQPKSSKVETSKLIFSALMKTFENKILDLETIYKAAITELASGMSNFGYRGIVNPRKLDFKDIYDLGYEGKHSKEIAEKLADRIHTWMLQGTAIKLTSPYNLIFWK